MRARDLKVVAFSMSDLRWKREKKHCPVKNSQSCYETTETLPEEERKKIQDFTCWKQHKTTLFWFKFQHYPHLLVKVTGTLFLNNIYLNQIFSINSKLNTLVFHSSSEPFISLMRQQEKYFNILDICS